MRACKIYMIAKKKQRLEAVDRTMEERVHGGAGITMAGWVCFHANII